MFENHIMSRNWYVQSWKNIVEKLTKSSKIGFSVECSTVYFLQKYQNFSLRRSID